MSHLAEKIQISNRRDLERAIVNEYGQIVINEELGKKVAELHDKKFYEGGITADEHFRNTSTEDVLKNQSIFFVLMPLLPSFACTRNDLREYTSEVQGETVVLTHNRNEL